MSIPQSGIENRMAIIYTRLWLNTEEIDRLYKESNKKSQIIFDMDDSLNAFDRLATAIVREWIYKKEIVNDT